MDHDAIEREIRYIHACFSQHTSINVPSDAVEECISDFSRMSECVRPLERGENAILSLFKPKIASLFGDRVWLPYPGNPEELDFAFGWESPMAIRLSAMMALWQASKSYEEDLLSFNSQTGSRSELSSFQFDTEKDLAKDYCQRTGANVTPLYGSASHRDAEYSPGDHTAVIAIAENLGVVSEDQIKWEQVLEFRKDKQARNAFRRLMHWLDKEMVGKPLDFVTDELSDRIEKYDWAIRKHGFQVVIGTLACTLNPKYLLGTSALTAAVDFVSHEPFLSLLTGSGLVIGRAALSLATTLVDRKDIEFANREVAFLLEAKRHFRDQSA